MLINTFHKDQLSASPRRYLLISTLFSVRVSFFSGEIKGEENFNTLSVTNSHGETYEREKSCIIYLMEVSSF